MPLSNECIGAISSLIFHISILIIFNCNYCSSFANLILLFYYIHSFMIQYIVQHVVLIVALQLIIILSQEYASVEICIKYLASW